MSRIVCTEQVKTSIDNFLGQEFWNNNHLQFYEMLLLTVKKYHKRALYYKNFSNDNRDIINNIKEQPWFQYSKNQNRILALLGKMYVHEIKTEPAYILRLNFGCNLWFVIQYFKQNQTDDEVKYRVSFCDNMDDHAYICYYSSKHPRSRKLPEYEKLENYINGLSRYDIIMLANELVIYYDCQYGVINLPIGHDYPLSLNKLAQETLKEFH